MTLYHRTYAFFSDFLDARTDDYDSIRDEDVFLGSGLDTLRPGDSRDLLCSFLSH